LRNSNTRSATYQPRRSPGTSPTHRPRGETRRGALPLLQTSRKQRNPDGGPRSEYPLERGHGAAARRSHSSDHLTVRTASPRPRKGGGARAQPQPHAAPSSRPGQAPRGPVFRTPSFSSPRAIPAERAGHGAGWGTITPHRPRGLKASRGGILGWVRKKTHWRQVIP